MEVTNPKNQSVKNLSVYPQQTDRSGLYSGKNLNNLLLVETGPWENVRAVKIILLYVINVFTGIKLLPQCKAKKKISAINRCMTIQGFSVFLLFSHVGSDSVCVC